MVFFHRRAIVCRQAVELVTEYLEGSLNDRDRARFEVHMADCVHCATYFEQMRATIAAAGRIEPDELAPEAQRELVGLYRRWLAD